MIRTIAVSFAIFVLAGSAQSYPAKSRPHYLTESQYQCLMAHRTKMKAVGGDGTLFDLSTCPKKPLAVNGAWPVKPSDKYIQLSKSDLDCLGDKKKKTAIRTANNKVAIYLDPCGA